MRLITSFILSIKCSFMNGQAMILIDNVQELVKKLSDEETLKSCFHRMNVH